MKQQITTPCGKPIRYAWKTPHKFFEKFSKNLYGTTGGTYSSRFLRPVMACVWIYEFFTVVAHLLSTLMSFWSSSLVLHHLITFSALVVHLTDRFRPTESALTLTGFPWIIKGAYCLLNWAGGDLHSIHHPQTAFDSCHILATGISLWRHYTLLWNSTCRLSCNGDLLSC